MQLSILTCGLCVLLLSHTPPWQRKSRGAAEFSWSIFNFQKDQDVRFKLGYEVVDKVFSGCMYVWFYNMKQFHSIFVLYDSDALFLVLFSYFSFDGVSHFISNFLSLDCTKLKCSCSVFWCIQFSLRFPICRLEKIIGQSMLTRMVGGMWDTTCEDGDAKILWRSYV